MGALLSSLRGDPLDQRTLEVKERRPEVIISDTAAVLQNSEELVISSGIAEILPTIPPNRLTYEPILEAQRTRISPYVLPVQRVKLEPLLPSVLEEAKFVQEGETQPDKLSSKPPVAQEKKDERQRQIPAELTEKEGKRCDAEKKELDAAKEHRSAVKEPAPLLTPSSKLKAEHPSAEEPKALPAVGLIEAKTTAPHMTEKLPFEPAIGGKKASATEILQLSPAPLSLPSVPCPLKRPEAPSHVSPQAAKSEAPPKTIAVPGALQPLPAVQKEEVKSFGVITAKEILAVDKTQKEYRNKQKSKKIAPVDPSFEQSTTSQASFSEASPIPMRRRKRKLWPERPPLVEKPVSKTQPKPPLTEKQEKQKENELEVDKLQLVPRSVSTEKAAVVAAETKPSPVDKTRITPNFSTPSVSKSGLKGTKKSTSLEKIKGSSEGLPQKKADVAVVRRKRSKEDVSKAVDEPGQNNATKRGSGGKSRMDSLKIEHMKANNGSNLRTTNNIHQGSRIWKKISKKSPYANDPNRGRKTLARDWTEIHSHRMYNLRGRDRQLS